MMNLSPIQPFAVLLGQILVQICLWQFWQPRNHFKFLFYYFLFGAVALFAYFSAEPLNAFILSSLHITSAFTYMTLYSFLIYQSPSLFILTLIIDRARFVEDVKERFFYEDFFKKRLVESSFHKIPSNEYWRHPLALIIWFRVYILRREHGR